MERRPTGRKVHKAYEEHSRYLRFVAKSLLRAWNLDSPEGVMKWLAERGITPEWDDRSGEASFFHLNRTAADHFKDVLKLRTKRETIGVKKQLILRPEWNTPTNEQSGTWRFTSRTERRQHVDGGKL